MRGSPYGKALNAGAACLSMMGKASLSGLHPWQWAVSHFSPRTGIPALIGSGTMWAAIAVLALTTIGLYRAPCGGQDACLLVPYSVYSATEVAAMLVLASLPLLLVVDSRPASRAIGIIGASGAVLLAWSSIFLWGARFTYGDRLVFLNGDGDTPFLMIWLLGTLMAGAGIAIFACLRRSSDFPRAAKAARGQPTSP